MNLTNKSTDQLTQLGIDIREELKVRAIAECEDPLSLIVAQDAAIRAITVAAVQHHPVLLYGGPDIGENALINLASRLETHVSHSWPCPCGQAMNPFAACSCSVQILRSHAIEMRKISRKYAIHIEVVRPTERQLSSFKQWRTFGDIEKQVQSARVYLPQVSPKIDSTGSILMRQAYTELGLGPEARNNIIEVSRSIAALDGTKNIAVPHLAEAIQYRRLDRKI